MSLSLTTAPTEEPVSLQEMKEFIGLDNSDLDPTLMTLLIAARGYAETYTKRQFCTATYTLKINKFPPKIYLPRPPLSSVTSITYLDTDGASQTLSSSVYQIINDGEGSSIVEAYNQFWPSYRFQPDTITIIYITGYGAASTVPREIKQAIMMLVKYWFDYCGGESTGNMPMAVTCLLDGYKCFDLYWQGPADGRFDEATYRNYQSAI